MGKTEKIISLSLLAVAILAFALSLLNFYLDHTKPVPARGGSYTEGFLGQPTYINPLLAHQENDLSLIKLVYSGLYKYDNQGNLIADLADGLPAISQDQKQYTINLKRNVSWHNGKPFTADDVIFTIQTLKDPSFKSPLRTSWLSTEVEKLSDYSVKFSTKDISGPFIHNLTLPILPEAVWSKVDAGNFLLSENNLKAIGTGPYAIKEIRKLTSGKVDQITLSPYGNYYASQPMLDTVTIKFYDTNDDLLNALHSKEIDGFGYMPLGSDLYVEKNQTDYQVLSIPLPQYQVIFFNFNNKILADQNVRQALALAIDRGQIIQNIFKGNALLPSSPFVMSNQPAQPFGPAAPQPEQARQLLDKAGWTIDAKTNLRAKKGQTLELTVSTNDFALNSKAAELVADQWKQLGLKVNLNVVPTKQLTENIIRPRNFDVLLFPQKFGADPDPFPFWHSSQVKDPGLNLTGFADAAADQLITQGRTTTKSDIRAQKYSDFAQLVNQKVPVIFLDQTIYVYAISKNIRNLGLNKIFDSSQRFSDLPNWYMETKRVWK